jgi:hypothetical protein
VKRETKAISSLILILIILCSVIFGALVSYMWVMANYYNMPENASLLVVESLEFSVADFTNFNVTVLNPSNSALDVNITNFVLRVETQGLFYVVPSTHPSVPFVIARGTRQSFKCMLNWSNMTGNVIRVEPVAGAASTRSPLYDLPYASLTATPNFDATQTVDYFNLTLSSNQYSATNLTISEIRIFSDIINVTTPLLPYVLQPNTTQVFQCYRNWNDLRGQNVTITVKSAEGYEIDNSTGNLPGAALSIANVTFDYSDSTYFNMTIASSEDSTAGATIDAINLTQQDGTTLSIGSRFPPLHTFFSTISPNQSLTFICGWNWTQYHAENITISAYTSQDFVVQNITVSTPPAIVWNVTDVNFDLSNLGRFAVNVTNMPISLHEVNITGILLNGNSTIIDPPFAILANGNQTTFNCSFDWTGLRGDNAVVTVLAEDGTNVSTNVALPIVGLKLLGDSFIYGSLNDQYPNLTIPFLIPYFNVTVTNSNNSFENLTITRIVLQTRNDTYEIDYNLTAPSLGPDGYTLKKGDTVTILCFWDWTRYLTTDHVKVTVYTAEGFQASRTW